MTFKKCMLVGPNRQWFWLQDDANQIAANKKVMLNIQRGKKWTVAVVGDTAAEVPANEQTATVESLE